MKTTYHIPTEQFGFIELEVDSGEDGQPLTEFAIENAVEGYKRVSGAVKGEAGIGLTEKDFQKALDEYLATGSLVNGTELYAEMNAEQQSVFQQLKKSFKRISYKNGK